MALALRLMLLCLVIIAHNRGYLEARFESFFDGPTTDQQPLPKQESTETAKQESTETPKDNNRHVTKMLKERYFALKKKKQMYIGVCCPPFTAYDFKFGLCLPINVEARRSMEKLVIPMKFAKRADLLKTENFTFYQPPCYDTKAIPIGTNISSNALVYEKGAMIHRQGKGYIYIPEGEYCVRFFFRYSMSNNAEMIVDYNNIEGGVEYCTAVPGIIVDVKYGGGSKQTSFITKVGTIVVKSLTDALKVTFFSYVVLNRLLNDQTRLAVLNYLNMLLPPTTFTMYKFVKKGFENTKTIAMKFANSDSAMVIFLVFGHFVVVVGVLYLGGLLEIQNTTLPLCFLYYAFAITIGNELFKMFIFYQIYPRQYPVMEPGFVRMGVQHRPI